MTAYPPISLRLCQQSRKCNHPEPQTLSLSNIPKTRPAFHPHPLQELIHKQQNKSGKLRRGLTIPKPRAEPATCPILPSFFPYSQEHLS
jgi:hypothetical protein